MLVKKMYKTDNGWMIEGPKVSPGMLILYTNTNQYLLKDKMFKITSQDDKIIKDLIYTLFHINKVSR